MNTVNDREVRVPVPMLFTGISQQPANVRLASQVQDASNVDFTVEHGATKRPYTKFYHKLNPAPTSGRDVRLHSIERDENERYVIAYGDGNLRVFQEMGVQPPVVIEAVVTTSANAQTYLSVVDGKSIVLVTVNDYTLAINTTVATGVTTSADYSLTATWDTFERMASLAPVEDTYHRTLGDSDAAKAGYYKYHAGTQTPGVLVSRYSSSKAYSTPTGYYDDPARNPGGFRIGFQRLAMVIAGGTLAVSGTNFTLTKVAAFTAYTFVAGDMIYVPTGTGVTAGWATIISRDSADQLTIKARGTTILAACIDATTNGIGVEYDVEINLDPAVNATPADMFGVAAAFQAALQKAGCADGLIAWTTAKNPITGTDGGYFQITSPYKGTDSVIKNISTPGTAIYDYSVNDVSTTPFLFSAITSNTAGTGGNPTTQQSVGLRWTRVPAPLQSQAIPDATKMPVQLVRNYDAVYPPLTISGWTAANPTQGTTAATHGFTDGQTVVVAGATGGSPGTINASHIVTVTGATTFTVPVNLSGGAATGGTVYGRAGFTCSTITWNTRLSGNELTNKAPKPFTDGLTITDAIVIQDRLVLALGQYLVFSQSGDLFDFYNEDAFNIVDSDPIIAPLAANQVVNVKFMVPYRQSILVFTFNGEHFDISWDSELTATKIRVTPAIKSQTWSTRPVRGDDRIYYNSERGSYAEVNEYHYDDLSTQNVAFPITTHCPTFVPLMIRTMCVVRTEGVLLLLPDDSTKIYCYRWHYSGNQKDQSAWTKYAFDTNYRISGMAPIRNSVYLLVQDASQWTIEAMVYEVPGDTF